MTRLVPAASGGGGGGGGGADGGRAGSLGGWLIKPGAAGGGSTDPPAGLSRRSAGPPEVVVKAAVGEQGAGSSSMPGDASTPAFPANDAYVKPCKQAEGPTVAGEEAATVDTNSGEEEGAGSTAAVRRQCTTTTTAAVEPSSGAASPLPKKRRREEEMKRDEVGPCNNALESPGRSTGMPPSLLDASDAASAPTKTAGGHTEATEADGAGGGSSPRIDSPDSARKRKAPRTTRDSSTPAGAPCNASMGGCATPSARRGAGGASRDESPLPPPPGIASSRQAGGNNGRFSHGGGFSPPVTRRTEPASPELLLSSPMSAVAGTPPLIGSAGSPSMSQVREAPGLLLGDTK